MKIEIEEQPDFAFRPYPRMASLIVVGFLFYLLILASKKGQLGTLLFLQVLLLFFIWVFSDSYRITDTHIIVKRIWTRPRQIPRSSIVKILEYSSSYSRDILVKYRKPNGKIRSIDIPTNTHLARKEKIILKLASQNFEQFEPHLQNAQVLKPYLK